MARRQLGRQADTVSSSRPKAKEIFPFATAAAAAAAARSVKSVQVAPGGVRRREEWSGVERSGEEERKSEERARSLLVDL